MTIALIDGDIVLYRGASSCEPTKIKPDREPLEVALARTDKIMVDILHETGAEDYLVFLSGTNNFRKDINPEYKANRKDHVKPRWFEQCGQYLIDEWNAEITDGYEADDALGFNQTKDTIICTIDKDLLQVPGRHYNFVKKEWQVVDELTGYKNFYKQMLTGDTSDNIFGIKGIGAVKAAKLIDPCTTHNEMETLVNDLYADGMRFYMNADCLWVMRKEGERFSDVEWG